MSDDPAKARTLQEKSALTTSPRGSSVRVMVVDDSSVVRGIVTRALEVSPGIKVVASVSNGALAIKMLPSIGCDVIVLDIEMPQMDGMEALPQLLAINPNVKIIMVSSLTRRNADVSLRALSLGAADYVPKPSTGLGNADAFRDELVEKVLAHGERAQRCRPAQPSGSAAAAQAAPALRVAGVAPSGPIALRKAAIERPAIIAIGSSTGGPQALSEVLKNLGHGVTQPIVITQHMPPTFTAILAEHMNRYAGRPAAEAKDGEIVQGGRIYVAPGGLHMLIEARGAQQVIRLSDAPLENSCRPAVDPMLRSLSEIHRKKLLTVILTGMGYDGLKGCRVVAEAGGTVIAQDQASSVVWGMPGAVAQAGICNAVLPLAQIGQAIGRVARGEPL
ncbi:MAG: chemotaxis response regulator protein-glutamate methylesterase [Parvibaculum sp.]|uniref:protein-glutamate methylesterase/protein-glutamine glutaminase n=1 Tax=Parvibaculum sp. TaxID=2024848 RepID=UPI0025EA59EE|nr:chemotaxis response regulator protein-glutamate methylesterase [Parvibaculum sp.]MCE9648518.1 chemotaxis response regulator protein-glutamate methylesterase [Parvibaculum sp.]